MGNALHAVLTRSLLRRQELVSVTQDTLGMAWSAVLLELEAGPLLLAVLEFIYIFVLIFTI